MDSNCGLQVHQGSRTELRCCRTPASAIPMGRQPERTGLREDRCSEQILSKQTKSTGDHPWKVQSAHLLLGGGCGSWDRVTGPPGCSLKKPCPPPPRFPDSEARGPCELSTGAVLAYFQNGCSTGFDPLGSLVSESLQSRRKSAAC